LFKKESKSKRSFSPIYLAILSGILLIILIINGMLEINRTKRGFYLLLEREGVVLLQHFEKNILETLEAFESLESGTAGRSLPPSLSEFFFNLEESIAEYLIEAAYGVDQIDGKEPLRATDLQSLAGHYLVTSIEFYDPQGRLLKGWPSPPPATNKQLLNELIQKKRSVAIDLFGKSLTGENQWFSIALWRKTSPGIMALHLSRDQMIRLLRQSAVHRAISDMGLREGVLYVAVLDTQRNVIAQTDPSSPAREEEDPFLSHALRSQGPSVRRFHPAQGEEVFEVVKPFSLDGRTLGLIRIGYSPKEIHPVLTQIEKNVALSILVFLILGISAITLIWVNQNRHLKKLKEMEDRIQLVERLSSLGHLAAGVAHEIRNPLNAIGMGLQRLKREFLPQDETKKEEYLSFTDLILREIKRVNEIVEQFLNLSRPFQLTLKETSLGELLKHLLVLLQEEAANQKVTLQAEISSDLPRLRVDEEKLTQAILNIMKNGLQAMEQGGMLRVEARSARDHAEITLSDTGSGIPPEQMDKIFNYYYTTKDRGVGLGLPIAHRIIEAHGGRLKVESRVGSGTKATITLPL
jgi:signal transduction histidine kinase